MYLITNTTKQTVVISDIKITLGARQGIDLDAFMSREVSERSQCLKSLFSKGILQIKNKDSKQIEIKEIQKEVIKNNDTIDVEKMKKEIIQGVKDSLVDIIPQQKQNDSGISKDELIKILTSLVGNNNIINGKNEEVLINDTVLSDIHKRAVDKLVKNVEKSEINYQNVKAEDKNIDNSVSELENML
jgi:hypothetical protein